MKILLDTNVILDAMIGRPPWNEAAEQIILQAAYYRVEAFITASSVTDLYYIVHKELREDAKTKSLLTSLLELIHILPVNEQDCILALHSDIKDFEDAVQDEVAARYKLDYIITRNVMDFEGGKVMAMFPTGIVDIL